MFRSIVCAALVLNSVAGDSATRPVLRDVELTESVYLLGYELHVTIGSDGAVHSVRKMGGEREVRSGRLSSAQVGQLAALFADWERWKSEYPGVADGGSVTLRFGTRSVRGGRLPGEVAAICARIRSLAESFPVES